MAFPVLETSPVVSVEPPGLSGHNHSRSGAPAKNRIKTAFWRAARALKSPAQSGHVLVLLREEALVLAETARLFARSDSYRSNGDLLPQFLALKNRCQELQRSLTVALRKVLIPPISPEDIQLLSVDIRKLLENIVEVVRNPLDLPHSQIAALREASDSIAIAVSSAIETLPNGFRMAAHTAQIAYRARRAEFLLRDCSSQRLLTESDLATLLKQKHASRALRSLFRGYRDMANALERIALKNS